MTKYCVYFHINPIKNEVFYVGIGNIKRPYQTRSRNKHWKHVVNKYGYIIKIIHENLSWDKACELEIKYINEFGRKDLKLGQLVRLKSKEIRRFIPLIRHVCINLITGFESIR